GPAVEGRSRRRAMSGSDVQPEIEMLYRSHAGLSSKLVGLQWCKQYVWDDRASVFEFIWGEGSRVAIDVFVGAAHGVKVHVVARSEEHTSELQSRFDLVCRLLLEKKKREIKKNTRPVSERD